MDGGMGTLDVEAADPADSTREGPAGVQGSLERRGLLVWVQENGDVQERGPDPLPPDRVPLGRSRIACGRCDVAASPRAPPGTALGLLPGPHNSVLTIFAPKSHGHPVGLGYKYQLIYSVSQSSMLLRNARLPCWLA